MLSKEELTERAQLIRVWEAACKIEYPTAEESNFRIAIAKRLGVEFKLRELRASTITGPTSLTSPARPVARPDRKAA